MKFFSFFLASSLLSLSLAHTPSFAAPSGLLSESRVPNVSSDYHAQRSRNARGDKMGIMEELNLSEAQSQKLATIRQKYQPQLRTLRDQMKTKRDEMRQLMGSNASSATIRAKNDEINKIRDKMENLRFESMMEMREVLTPDQRREFAQLMEQRRENARSRRPNAPNAPMEEPDDFAP